MNPSAIPSTREFGVVVVGQHEALETRRAYTSALKDLSNYMGVKADQPVSLLTLADFQGFEQSNRPGKSFATRKRDMQAVRGLIRQAIFNKYLPDSFWNPVTVRATAAALPSTPTAQPMPAAAVSASTAVAAISTRATAMAPPVSGPASCTMTPPSNPVPTAALPDPGELLTFKKARAVADVSRGTLWRWTKAGLPIRGKMGVKRIGRDDLKRFLGIPVSATPTVT